VYPHPQQDLCISRYVRLIKLQTRCSFLRASSVHNPWPLSRVFFRRVDGIWCKLWEYEYRGYQWPFMTGTFSLVPLLEICSELLDRVSTPYFRLCNIASLAPCCQVWHFFNICWPCVCRLLVNMCKLCYWEDNGGWFIPIMSVCLPFHEDDVAGPQPLLICINHDIDGIAFKNWWGGILTPCCQAWICSHLGSWQNTWITKTRRWATEAANWRPSCTELILLGKMLEGHLLRMIVNMASPHRSPH